MTPIEILALIFVVLAVVKLVVIAISPKSWAGVVKNVWKSPRVVALLSFILAIIVLYYLLQELTIIQIFGAMVFTALLAALGIALYANEIVAIAQKILKDKKIFKSKKLWFYILIWIILIIWVLIALF